MERVKKELKVSVGQATTMATGRKNLEEDVGSFCRRVTSRNTQLKSS